MSRERELRNGIRELESRCLYASVKWAAELLYSENEVDDSATVSTATSASPPLAPAPAIETHIALEPALLLAKSYFDAKEFRRCAHVLRASHSLHAVFLRGYALFMAGEKQKEEEVFESKDLSHAAVGARFLGAATASATLSATSASGAPVAGAPHVNPHAVTAAAVASLLGSAGTPASGSDGGVDVATVVAGGGSAGTAVGLGNKGGAQSSSASPVGVGQSLRILQLQRGVNREARALVAQLQPSDAGVAWAAATSPIASSAAGAFGRDSIGDAGSSSSDSVATDGYCQFLLALALHSLGQREAAVVACVRAVNAVPLLWSAWRLLVTLCADASLTGNGGGSSGEGSLHTDVRALRASLTTHWARAFFDAELALEAQHTSLPSSSSTAPSSAAAAASTTVASSPSDLELAFPRSTHTLAARAVCAYNARDFDAAQALFEQLRDRDPHRLEHMDTFSNILYIREQRTALSYLAHAAHKADKYRPETCCIVGNYYSLKGDHERALVYFRRALRLQPTYLAAWTLMGHEFVELRNTQAAIEAYRCAVDINARDYRAWYGLGQTYEILQMHAHALFYFGKAAALRPYDPRMWCALAESYERLDRIEDAIRCYLRAEGNRDREGIALLRLAKLHARLAGAANRDKAAEYYRRVLQRDAETRGAASPLASAGVDASDGNDDAFGGGAASSVDTIEARMFLAAHARDRARYDEAAAHCARLVECGGATRDAARALLSEVRAMQAAAQHLQTVGASSSGRRS